MLSTVGASLFYILSLGMLYFLMSSGFSIIYGLMRILNFSHGVLFLWGAYITFSAYQATGSFWIATLTAGLVIGLVGVLIQVVLLRNLKGDMVNQVLLTNGLISILYELIKITYGARSYAPNKPAWLATSMEIGSLTLPVFRMIIIVTGIAVYVLVWALLHKTKLGMTIQAGTERPRMLRASGINIKKIFTITFALGSALAGIAGSMGCFYFGLFPELHNQTMFLILIIVVVGGIGSYTGSFVGSLLVAAVQYILGLYVPDIAMIAPVALMLIVLAFKPKGLFGGEANA